MEKITLEVGMLIDGKEIVGVKAEEKITTAHLADGNIMVFHNSELEVTEEEFSEIAEVEDEVEEVEDDELAGNDDELAGNDDELAGNDEEPSEDEVLQASTDPVTSEDVTV